MKNTLPIMTTYYIAQQLLKGYHLSLSDLARLALEAIESLGDLARGLNREELILLLRNTIRSGAAAVKALLGVKGYYEGFHNVVIPNDIVKKAVILSERYVTDRYLPDKAIDLLDEVNK